MTEQEIEQKAKEYSSDILWDGINLLVWSSYKAGANMIISSPEYVQMVKDAGKFRELVQKWDEIEDREEDYPGQNADDKLDVVIDIIS